MDLSTKAFGGTTGILVIAFVLWIIKSKNTRGFRGG